MAQCITCQRAEDLGVGFSCDDKTFGGPDPTDRGIGFQPLPFWVFLMSSDHLSVSAAVTHISALAAPPPQTPGHEHSSFQG